MTAPDTAWAIRAEKDGDVDWVTPCGLDTWYRRELFYSLAEARSAFESAARSWDKHRFTVVRVTRRVKP